MESERWNILKDERMDLSPINFSRPSASINPHVQAWSQERLGFNIKIEPKARLELSPTLKNASLEDNFKEIKTELTRILERLGRQPESIEVNTDPEDGEQEIIVAVRVNSTGDPFDELLKLHRKLRKINWKLAEKIVILPAE